MEPGKKSSRLKVGPHKRGDCPYSWSNRLDGAKPAGPAMPVEGVLRNGGNDGNKTQRNRRGTEQNYFRKKGGENPLFLSPSRLRSGAKLTTLIKGLGDAAYLSQR